MPRSVAGFADLRRATDSSRWSDAYRRGSYRLTPALPGLRAPAHRGRRLKPRALSGRGSLLELDFQRQKSLPSVSRGVPGSGPEGPGRPHCLQAAFVWSRPASLRFVGHARALQAAAADCRDFSAATLQGASPFLPSHPSGAECCEGGRGRTPSGAQRR